MTKTNINLSNIKKFIKIKNLPAFFERYEIFVIITGACIVFLIAGYIFYQKAYKIVSIPPEAEVQLPQINTYLFDKTLKEIEAKKQATPGEPAVDPFR